MCERRALNQVKRWQADAFHPGLSLLILTAEGVQEPPEGLAEDKACSISLFPLESFWNLYL